MYRRYRDYRQRRRRSTNRRPRSILKRPGVQIAILIIVALIIYIILQSGSAAGNSLPHEMGMVVSRPMVFIGRGWPVI
jgi:hypothetical protein